MVTAGIAGVGLVNAEAAQASGCTIPPCGAVNNLSDRSVQVRWSNNNNGWTYAWVDPGRTIGGYFNDKRDVDYWNVPSGCTGYWTGQGTTGSTRSVPVGRTSLGPDRGCGRDHVLTEA